MICAVLMKELITIRIYSWILFVCLYIFICVWKYVETRGQCQVLSQSLHLSLILQLTSLDWLARETQGVLSASPLLRLQAHATTELTKSVGTEHKNDRLKQQKTKFINKSEFMDQHKFTYAVKVGLKWERGVLYTQGFKPGMVTHT